VEVKECSPSAIGEYVSLSAALKKGQTIHGFRSGGGLRVVRLSKGDKLKAYGEHPYVYNALDHAEEDCMMGGRSYNKVYGKIYDHYLTGAQPQGGFDSWVYCGRAFDFMYENGKFVFSSKFSRQRKVPKEIDERVRTTGKTELWESDGYHFETSLHTTHSGYRGAMTRLLTETKDSVWFTEEKIRFEAETLHDLIVFLDKEFSESDKWD
jgi:hypothetical protein